MNIFEDIVQILLYSPQLFQLKYNYLADVIGLIHFYVSIKEEFLPSMNNPPSTSYNGHL